MINTGSIIDLSLLKLGEVGTLYSDNRSEVRQLAQLLLNNILDQVAIKADFLFNATTVNLNKNLNEKNIMDEVRFNLPNDFLNVIRASEDYRIEGEYLYSPADEVQLTYCRKILTTEYPDYMKSYLIYALASELCDTYSAYASKKATILAGLKEELINVSNIEGLAFRPVNDII